VDALVEFAEREDRDRETIGAESIDALDDLRVAVR